jgi:hypothetical protein
MSLFNKLGAGIGTLTISGGGGQANFYASLPVNLYTFTSFVFSNASATSNVGPTYTQVKTAYSATSWTQNQAYLDVVTNGFQLWTVPTTASYTIECAGAAGGNYATYSNGAGNVISSTVSLTQGDKINICVGQAGTTGSGTIAAGGGGGSFVVWSNNTPIIIAGGGGGTSSGYPTGGPGIGGVATTSGTVDAGGLGTGGTNGSGGVTASTATSSYGHGGGGAGLLGNGTTIATGQTTWHGQGGRSYANGLVGGARGGAGVYGGTGGFGGGGGGGGTNSDTRSCSGGGGGYSGGAGGAVSSATNGGGGGGSYSVGSITVIGRCTSNGYVKITKL